MDNSDLDTDNLDSGANNVIAALGQSNRVYEVNLDIFGLEDQELEEVLAAMQVPFPELTDLQLDVFSYDEVPVIPDSFLGGSAPRLRYFSLSGVPFPGLPNLLLSATRLVYLVLDDLPRSGYISPEAIVALLSALSSLRIFSLGFKSDESGPDRGSQSLPSPKRCILPALRKLYFKGAPEYLERLVARIDTPLLYYMDIRFFIDIDFDTPRLTQFINCTPTLTALDEGQVQSPPPPFPVVTLRHRTSGFRFDKLLISISYSKPRWPLSYAKACNSSLHPLSTVVDLYIDHEYLVSTNDAIENAPWLELFRPFTAVKNLYLSKVFAPGIADSLQELVGARITEVLPSLQNIFVERPSIIELLHSRQSIFVEGLEPGPFREITAQFVAARQLSGHPVAISAWYKNSFINPMIRRM